MSENPYAQNYQRLVKQSQKSKLEQAFLSGIRQAGLPEPEREFRFNPERRWRVDFAWPEQRLFAEIEGGIFKRGGGGHSHPVGIMRDIEKGNAITLAGYRLLRFTDKEIKSGQAFELVRKCLGLWPTQTAGAAVVVDPVYTTTCGAATISLAINS